VSPLPSFRTPALIATATGVVAVLAFVVARYWQWLGVLLFLIVLLSALVVLLYFRQRRLQKASDEAERAVAKQVVKDVEQSTAGRREEEVRLANQFKAALEKYRVKTGNSPFSVPWYFVMGSDKTEGRQLVARSGLAWAVRDDSLEPSRVEGVGGLRGLEGFLGRQAIFWVMPGDSAESRHAGQSDTWIELLKVLRKARPDRPVNGLVVTIAADQLASAGEAANDRVARELRDRIQLMVDQLGVVFPVYVVCTACDRIGGFARCSVASLRRNSGSLGVSRSPGSRRVSAGQLPRRHWKRE
jgi:type VI secretion system protein ImpL